MADERLAWERTMLLLQQLKEEEPRISNVELSRRTGIGESYLSKLLSGERTNIGGTLLQRIPRSMGMDPDFFMDPTLKDPHYRQFLLRAVESDFVLRSVRQVQRLAPSVWAELTAENQRAIEQGNYASGDPGFDEIMKRVMELISKQRDKDKRRPAVEPPTRRDGRGSLKKR